MVCGFLCLGVLMKVHESSGGMWCLVMFDVPVKTVQQRRDATAFRNLLLDLGFAMVQFSVYARYTPTQAGNRAAVKAIKRGLPANGQVRVVHITDTQWASALRYSSRKEETEPEAPDILTLF